MSNDERDSTREQRMKKIAIVYKKYIKNTEQVPRKSNMRIKVVKEKTKEEKESKTAPCKTAPCKTDPCKVLNKYQLFVRAESKKDKYKDMTAKKRMEEIAKAWEKDKNKHLKTTVKTTVKTVKK